MRERGRKRGREREGVSEGRERDGVSNNFMFKFERGQRPH